MKGLIIIAHGSRVAEANEEIAHLSDQVSKLLKDSSIHVSFAYLGNATPAPLERIDEMVQNGVQKIILFPYFLSNGRHVRDDIPEIKKNAEEKFPEVGFVLTTHLGGLEDIGYLIGKELTEKSFIDSQYQASN